VVTKIKNAAIFVHFLVSMEIHETWDLVSSYLSIQDYDNLRKSTSLLSLSLQKYCHSDEYVRSSTTTTYLKAPERTKYQGKSNVEYLGFLRKEQVHLFQNRIPKHWERLKVLPEAFNFFVAQEMCKRADVTNLNRMIPYLDQLSYLERTKLFRSISYQRSKESKRVLIALYRFGIQDLQTAFEMWCYLGELDLAKEVYPHIDPSMRSSKGFVFACMEHHVVLVEWLLSDSRVDPTVDEDACLRFACVEGHSDIVRLLLQDGRCDPNVRNGYCLRWATERGHQDIVQMLKEDGRVAINDS
jgi:hypothetical protein